MKHDFSRIEEAIGATAQGQVLIVVDSEDREDEGDFFIAADLVTPEAIHFMISEGRGQLCMPVMPDVATRLLLKSMVDIKECGEQPRFAIPLDHRSCRSGISPAERAFTIRAMVDPSSRANDFVRPGHIFPLVAEPAGVLSRTGHTEAAVDLSRYAGLTPAGVLCEICSQDGQQMAKRAELHRLADRFGLHMVAIDDLIAFRKRVSNGNNGNGTYDSITSPQKFHSIGTSP